LKVPQERRSHRIKWIRIKKESTETNRCFLFITDFTVFSYPTVIASAGHSLAQAPQSTQVSASTTATLSSTLIAPTGQTLSHTPQPKHFSVSTLAAMIPPFVFVFLE